MNTSDISDRLTLGTWTALNSDATRSGHPTVSQSDPGFSPDDLIPTLIFNPDERTVTLIFNDSDPEVTEPVFIFKSGPGAWEWNITTVRAAAAHLLASHGCHDLDNALAACDAIASWRNW